MADATNAIGAGDESVRLRLGDKDVVISESYEISIGVFTQPNAFALQLGWGESVRDIIQANPPNTKFELFIGDDLQQTGRTDGYRVASNGGAPVVHIRGRDAMAPLNDGCVPGETSFADKTFRELVEAAMRGVKHPGSLILVDTESRNERTGVTVRTSGEPKSAESVAVERGRKGVTTTIVRANAGERWLQFLNRELAHAGLFLWASAFGDLVLSRPSITQEPAYRIYRTRDRRGRNQTTITDWDFKNETTRRFSEATVYSRAGGKKFGRSKVKGAFEDEEMQRLGYDRPIVITEASVPDQGAAELVARRKLAEARRDGFQLSYTVAGHRTPSLFGGRAVWSPNTIVDVFDEDLGIADKFWIERVTHAGPPTKTTVTLVRTTDLFFESGDE